MHRGWCTQKTARHFVHLSAEGGDEGNGARDNGADDKGVHDAWSRLRIQGEALLGLEWRGLLLAGLPVRVWRAHMLHHWQVGLRGGPEARMGAHIKFVVQETSLQALHMLERLHAAQAQKHGGWHNLNAARLGSSISCSKPFGYT